MKLYTCTKCGKKKQQHEFRTRNSNSSGIETVCKACVAVASKAYYEANKSRVKQKTRKYKEENLEKIFATQKAYREAHKVSLKANRDMARANAYNANRYAAKLKAKPSWLTPHDLADIKSVYKSCRNISKRTGIQHHVDHIIPLQGKTVCGLHVPHNLRVLPAEENLRKSNSFDEDMV